MASMPTTNASGEEQSPTPEPPSNRRRKLTANIRSRLKSMEAASEHTVLVMIKKVLRIALLLTTGYNSTTSQRKYEGSQDWHTFRSTLLIKIENIGVVSGLLLASSSNLLIAGDLRRMTHIATMASIYGSIISIISGILCTWLLVGAHARNLQYLLRRRLLFYYLYATPSLFGGAAALSFFVAVGAWTWLDQADNKDIWAGRILAIVLSAILMINAMFCFALGARNYIVPKDVKEDVTSPTETPVVEPVDP